MVTKSYFINVKDQFNIDLLINRQEDMFPKDEFRKYATKHLNMSGMHLDKYMGATVPNINGFTPQVIEERQMNVASMDVFSRLMMDRIIFMGVPVNDYVANVIQAQLLFLESTDPKSCLLYTSDAADE